MAGSRLEESDGEAVVPFLVPQLPGKKLPQEETQVTSVSTFVLGRLQSIQFSKKKEKSKS